MHPTIALQIAAFDMADRHQDAEARRIAKGARRARRADRPLRTWLRRSERREVPVRRLRPA